MLIGAVLVAAIALVAATRRASHIREISDGAILEIYTLEALRGRQLLGPYSRFGWHHPGPIYFYLLAPWYGLSGLQTAGVQAGALVINLTALWLIIRTVIADASGPTAIVVSGVTTWYAFRTGDMLASAWNPHVIVIPLVAYVVLAAATAARPRRWSLLVLACVGAFLSQTHLATVPIVVALGAAAAFRSRRLPVTTWGAAVGLTLLLWIPPIIEQMTRHPGNLSAIARFFLDAGRGQAYLVAVRAWASAFTAAFRSDFVSPLGADYIPASGWILPTLASGLLLALIVTAVKARRSLPFEAWLLGMSALATAVALTATTRIQDHIIDHEVFWISAIGALGVAAMVGSIAALTTRMETSGHRSVVSGAGIVALAACLAAGVEAMNHALDRRRTLDDHAVDVLTEQIQGYLDSSSVRMPLFDIDPPAWPIAAGALLQIDKAGTRFAVGNRWVPMFGERFAPTGQEDGTARIAGSAASTSVTPR